MVYSRPKLPAIRPKLACYNTEKEFPMPFVNGSAGESIFG